MPRKLTPGVRHKVMASIRREHTKPEIIVRRMLWNLGARYRLHAKDLPGKPDIVMRSKRKAIFVHGCLWHLHGGCKLARIPKSRPDYWPTKLSRNVARDVRNIAELRRLGWQVEVIWECETQNLERLADRLRQLLSLPRATIA
jgi:DNA mismatch endonuclease, patch repair protein